MKFLFSMTVVFVLVAAFVGAAPTPTPTSSECTFGKLVSQACASGLEGFPQTAIETTILLNEFQIWIYEAIDQAKDTMEALKNWYDDSYHNVAAQLAGKLRINFTQRSGLSAEENSRFHILSQLVTYADFLECQVLAQAAYLADTHHRSWENETTAIRSFQEDLMRIVRRLYWLLPQGMSCENIQQFAEQDAIELPLPRSIEINRLWTVCSDAVDVMSQTLQNIEVLPGAGSVILHGSSN